MQAIFERAYRLGLANSDERRRFYQTLNAPWWKKSEPYSEHIPEETPDFARRLVDALLARGLSRADIAEMAGLTDFHGSTLLEAQGGSRPRLTLL